MIRRWLWNASTRRESPEISGSFQSWARHLAPHRIETILSILILCFGAGYLYNLFGGSAEDYYGRPWDGALYYLLWIREWLSANAGWATKTAIVGAMIVLPLWLLFRIVGLISRD